MNTHKKISRSLSLILTALLLIFAYQYISDIVRQANFADISVKWPFLVLSAILFMLFYVVLSLHWLLCSRILNGGTSSWQALAFFASQPYKYLPTSLFTFSARAVYAKKLGLSLKQSSAAQVFENASMLGANFGLFTAVYAGITSLWYSALIIVAITGMLFLMDKRKSFRLKFRGRQLDVATRRIVQMYVLATFGWFISGLAFIALNAALGLRIEFLDFLAANTIAFSLSLLAFFAPGGIGIREVVYDLFSVSGVAILFWRILTFALDFLLGGVAIVLIKRRSARS